MEILHCWWVSMFFSNHLYHHIMKHQVPKAASCFPYKPEISFSIELIDFGRGDQVSAQEGEKTTLFRADFNKLRGRQFSTF